MATGGRDDYQAVNGIPNFSTAVPNRIFVGGISSKTNEEDLRSLFSKYGNVKATKIILENKTGTSKGYGFVTFETDEEARNVLALVKAEGLTLKERKLNIAAAYKKHLYNRNREPSSIHGASVVWPSHPYSGSAGFQSRELSYYPQATWPLLWHQPLHYLPQQYPYAQTPQPGYPQYVCSVAPPEYQYQSGGQVAGSDYLETSSADSDNGNRSRASTPIPATAEYDRNRPAQQKSCHDQNASVQKVAGSYVESPSSYVHSSPVPQLHHVLTKTVNGVAVMAYPAPFVMGSPTILHMKDGNADSENVLYELGYMHSSLASGALTPPPTPMSSMSCDFNTANTSMESSSRS